MKQTSFSVLFAAAGVISCAAPALAQEESDDEMFPGHFLEVSHPASKADVKAHEFFLQLEDEANKSNLTDVQRAFAMTTIQSVYERHSRWRAEAIRVCVMDKANPTYDLREKIADVARLWEVSGSTIKFDFGDDFAIRLCSEHGGPSTADIRIDFGDQRFYSLVGNRANSVPTYEETMSLGDIHKRRYEIREFNRLVLHEFGHALGLLHEHQSPNVNCAAQLLMDKVKNKLTKPPYKWSEKEIEKNFEQAAYEAVEASAYDPKSVMNYSLEAEYYQNASQNVCYHAPNFEISEQDRNFARAIYAANMEELKADFTAAVTLLSATPEELESFQQEFEALQF